MKFSCLWFALLGLCAILPAYAAPPTQANNNPGLVAWYRPAASPGNVVKDESGHGNDLHPVDAVTFATVQGRQGARIADVGYLQAAPSPSLELGGEMTLEAWVRPDSHRPSGMRILDRQTVGGNDGFMLDTYPAGHLRLIVGPGQLRDPDSLPVGVWTHVAVTYAAETGEAYLYRDGHTVAEGVFAGRLLPSTHPLNIGASQGGGDRFEGLIGEIRIYARALAPEEIAAHATGREIEPPATASASLAPLPVLTRGDMPQVNYAALVASHDLVYLQPALYPFEAMRLGNGNLGVTTWNAGGMTWQLNNGSYRRGNDPVSSGQITLTTPTLERAAIAVRLHAHLRLRRFEQRLRLWDGVVTTRTAALGGTADINSFVVEGADCLVAHCVETVSGPRVVTLHLWTSRNEAHFEQGPNWVAVTEHSDHAEPFLATDMALVVQVDGAHVTAAKRDARTLTLTLNSDAHEFTIYAANPLTRNGEAGALRAGQATIARLRARGYAALLAERASYWHSFWPHSFIHLASRNGEAEFLENLWYLFHYDLASMSRHTLCPKFNGGNYLVQDDLRHWNGGYWHQNTREIFWPVYAAGHSELSDPFFELYNRAAATARESGQRGLNTDGYYIPEWIPVNPGPIRAPKDFAHPGYTAFIYTVGLEVALQGWWRYEFTGDEKFLRDTVYPLLKGSLDFYLHYAKKGADGKYHIAPADAQESYWLVQDPAQDLAALRWAIPVTLQISQRLNLDAAMRPQWQEFLDNLAPFPVDPDKKMLREADLPSNAERHNWENVADYAIYPFSVFGLGRPDYDLARHTFENRPIPGMGNGWEPAAIAAARLGLADEAARLTLEHMRANLRTVAGGWYSPTTAVFAGNVPDSPYYDAPGVCAQALQEMLLQSQDNVIRLAPAWPARWQAQFRLLARGGFVATAESADGKVRYALIESTRGGVCRVANPWAETAIISSRGATTLRSRAAVLEFPTVVGRTYRLERIAQPLAAMGFAPLAPLPATGPRYIGSHLPPYPNWNFATYLGIDSDGHTPQRAMMMRAVTTFQRRLATVTVGLNDVSTGKAVATLVAADGQTQPAPALTDGVTGATATIEVPKDNTVILDLGVSRSVETLVFSRDQSGLRVDNAASGYTWEGSADGVNWKTLLDRAKTGATPAGQIEQLPTPSLAHYLRLRPLSNDPVVLDEVTVYAK